MNFDSLEDFLNGDDSESFGFTEDDAGGDEYVGMRETSIQNMGEFQRLEMIQPPDDASSVIICAIQIDDSRSMNEAEKIMAIKEGLEGAMKNLKGLAENENKCIHLLVAGFEGIYYEGDILGCNIMSVVNSYNPNHGSTPLTTLAVNLAVGIENLGQAYFAAGYRHHVMVQIMTDGMPTSDDRPLEDYNTVIRFQRSWVVCALGILGNELSKQGIEQIFRRMGITAPVPATAEEAANIIIKFSNTATAF